MMAEQNIVIYNTKGVIQSNSLQKPNGNTFVSVDLVTDKSRMLPYQHYTNPEFFIVLSTFKNIF